jgi:hypothetical protein
MTVVRTRDSIRPGTQPSQPTSRFSRPSSSRALEYELREHPDVLERLVRALGLEVYLEGSPELVAAE